VIEVAWVDVDVVKLGERGFGGIKRIGGEWRADIDPLAIADIGAYQLAFVVEARLWKILRCFNSRRVSE
jgi:hypothetical protein